MEINVGILDAQIVLKTLVGTQWIFVIALGTTFLNHAMFTEHQPQCVRYDRGDSDMYGCIVTPILLYYAFACDPFIFQ